MTNQLTLALKTPITVSCDSIFLDVEELIIKLPLPNAKEQMYEIEKARTKDYMIAQRENPATPQSEEALKIARKKQEEAEAHLSTLPEEEQLEEYIKSEIMTLTHLLSIETKKKLENLLFKYQLLCYKNDRGEVILFPREFWNNNVHYKDHLRVLACALYFFFLEK